MKSHTLSSHSWWRPPRRHSGTAACPSSIWWAPRCCRSTRILTISPRSLQISKTRARRRRRGVVCSSAWTGEGALEMSLVALSSGIFLRDSSPKNVNSEKYIHSDVVPNPFGTQKAFWKKLNCFLVQKQRGPTGLFWTLLTPQISTGIL